MVRCLRERASRVASGLVLLALVAACSQSAPTQTRPQTRPSELAPSAPAAAPATPAELTKVRIGLTGVSPSYWPGYVGLDRGYFLQEGLDFETLIVQSSVTQTQALIAGDFNFNAYSV